MPIKKKTRSTTTAKRKTAVRGKKPAKTQGRTLSAETRDKISSALKGLTPWNKGKKTGIKPWNKGKRQDS